MKKTGIILLALALLFSLSGCASKEAKAVNTAIKEIGTVTLESADAIEQAETAYEALSEKDKKAVHSDKLAAARAEYDTLVEIDAVEKAIRTLEEEVVTPKNLQAAQEAYDALGEEKQARVSNAQTLTGQAHQLGLLYGDWSYELDISDEMNETMNQIFSMMGVEADVDGTMVLPVTVTLGEDGAFILRVDAAAMPDSFKSYMAQCTDVLTEMQYQIVEVAGYTREEIDDAYEEEYGMSVSEYSESLLDSFTAEDFGLDQLQVQGVYGVEGDHLYIAETADDFDVSGYEVFELTGDTLTFTSGSAEEGFFQYPTTLNRK